MLSHNSRYRGIHTFDQQDWALDAAKLKTLKKNQLISVCIPCHNEEATVGAIVKEIQSNLVDRIGLIDEVVVIDDRSHDNSAKVANNSGAKVFHIDEVCPHLEPGCGKGNVLWSTLAVSKGDFIVWCDADLLGFTYDWIIQLVSPLFADPDIAFVKGFYERQADLTTGYGGGRTTELTARPLLSLLFPELTPLHQPLSGEAAGRRSHLERIPFVQGWGVDIGILIDLLRLSGPASIAQINLGVRHHRHRPLSELSIQAAEVALTLLMRSDRAHLENIDPVFYRPDGVAIELNIKERPPLISLKKEHL